MTNSYETVNDVLVKLFKEIMGIEEKALITSEYKDISVNDMHVIEAIGIHEKKYVSGGEGAFGDSGYGNHCHQ